MPRAGKADTGFDIPAPAESSSTEGTSEGHDLEMSAAPGGAGWAHIAGGRARYPFDARFGVSTGGRPMCIAVRVGVTEGDEAPYQVGVHMLKTLPITQATSQLWDWSRSKAKAQRDVAQAVLADAPVVRPAGTPGRQGYSDDMLRKIAEGYAALVAKGVRHPLTHLAVDLDRSEAQARRLVKQAHERFPDMATDKETG